MASSVVLNRHLIKKLSWFGTLSTHDKDMLAQLIARRTRSLASGVNIIEEGEQPTAFYLLQEGWSYGYKVLENGRRQIIAFLLPGDVCYLNLFLLKRMDHSIRTITPVVISEVTRREFDGLVANSSSVGQALSREALSSAAIQREWTVNIAQRPALKRVAHLICELFIRLENVGLTNGRSCEFPLTQMDLGDALGLTGIHVNRVLQRLRSLNLLALKGRVLTIPDIQALRQLAGFNSSYLQLT